jgi:hypothetical protein
MFEETDSLFQHPSQFPQNISYKLILQNLQYTYAHKIPTVITVH